MKPLTWLMILLSAPALVAVSGCQTMKEHPVITGAAIGTATGAAAGAVIAGKEDRGKGALIGAAAGAAVGTAAGYGVGKWMDRESKKYEKIDGVEVEKTGQAAEQPAGAPAAGAEGTPAAPAEKPHITLRMSSDLLFDRGSADLKQEGVAKLAEIAQVLKADPTAKVMVKGYTSSEGPSVANLVLSKKRAEIVQSQLISDGVDPGRIQAVGLGSSSPIADNSTEEGRMRNRRVEIEVIPAEGAQ